MGGRKKRPWYDFVRNRLAPIYGGEGNVRPVLEDGSIHRTKSQAALLKDMRMADEIGNNRQFNVRQKRRWANLRAELVWARRLSPLAVLKYRCVPYDGQPSNAESCLRFFSSSPRLQQPMNRSKRSRGYYFTFCRMPTFGLAESKQIYDRIHSDGGNTVLLWIGGGFRSRKFPVTWQYNRDHKNIQADFVHELIDYGHRQGNQDTARLHAVSYDCVLTNTRLSIRYQQLRGRQYSRTASGLAKLSGIHCWDMRSTRRARSPQKFMLDYIREMFFDFYPNADGLMIESSDYAICFCSGCQGHSPTSVNSSSCARFPGMFCKARKPDATILVYPHYFPGQERSRVQCDCRKASVYDSRWALFFTPHSAHLDADLLRQAKTTIYWDTSPALKTPHQIQEGARTAAAQGIPGYVPIV